MTFMLLMASAAINTIQFVFVGGAVFVGFVFFLIGWPQSKSIKKWFTLDMIKFALTVFFTLLTLIVYMVVTYRNVRTSSTLAFIPPYSIDVYLMQAKSLVLWGFMQGAFALLAFKWMLPLMFGELKLDKKHNLIVAGGALLTIAGGSVAWMSSV
ncbi:hypothetical protein MH117_06315 [Paenibacillus sp. ACRRX]|uniref:hypothetical protein n=1 Tax=Paenibacillus sp. ACRRX TaxID=2918206 RepID=UPI001EF449A2|nr:hypothetical protein [Paenibacillus sp. ACRRX]MCG7407027.1 hypothetical protein [Paenibacillus sp. ACRRX]